MERSFATGIDPGPLALWAEMFQSLDPSARIPAVESALKSPQGNFWKQEIGKWIGRLVPIEILVPKSGQRWRPLVRDAFQFFFEHLSDHRLATKVVQQFELPRNTPPEQRLLRLLNKIPGLQKMGQVLARNRRLEPKVRRALAELENGMSDLTVQEVRHLIHERLGERLAPYSVELDSRVLSEASVSTVIRFYWNSPRRERQQGVFKVLKPYVPECFGEDVALLRSLGEFLTRPERGYAFAVHDVREMLTEVLLLLSHELDFRREQASLLEAVRMYRASIGIRVPRLIAALSSRDVTAMSAEAGVKVTEAFPQWPVRRAHVADQVIEALIAVPFFSRTDPALFHADPHAGNLLYDEVNRELVILDWALAEELSLESRRQLVLLSAMMTLRNREGVRAAIRNLSLSAGLRNRSRIGEVDACVDGFFDGLPEGRSIGTLDAMRVLDGVALKGVHFPPSLFLFRKIVLTLDGVLYDIAGSDVRVDEVIAREFLTRCISSLGLFHAPLKWEDLATIDWNVLLYPLRRLAA